MIKAILASTKDGGIGFNGTLPWPKNSEDLKWFKKHTLGQVVVMGRNTWDDPLMPKPLPNRESVVITNRLLPKYCPSTLSMKGDILAALDTIQSIFADRDVFVIGGKSLYEASIPKVDEVYLTVIDGNYDTDVELDLTSFLLGFTMVYRESAQGNTYEIWRRDLAAIPQPTTGHSD